MGPVDDAKPSLRAAVEELLRNPPDGDAAQAYVKERIGEVARAAKALDAAKHVESADAYRRSSGK